MKRDFDLIRKILIEIENRIDAGLYSEPVIISDVNEETVSFHVMLLDEAGLIVGEEMTGDDDALYWNAKRLTNSGYDFLASIKNDSVWSSVTAKVMKLGGQVPIAFVTEIAKMVFKSYAKTVLPGLDAA